LQAVDEHVEACELAGFHWRLAMGMFDSLYVDCKCGEKVEFQSKRGDCALHEYSLQDCPPNIAGDLVGQSERCKCGCVITLRGAVVLLAERT
jgi:hypothetical protein